jgi:hypothetical protein
MLIRAVGSDTTTLSPFFGGTIGLLKSTYGPTPDSVYTGDVATHEADFTGYAKKPVIFGPPTRGQNTFVLAEATAPLTFIPTDSTKPNNIFGWFYLGADSVTLFGVEMFNAAIPLPDPNHSVTGLPILGINSAALFGNSMVSN